MSNELDYIHLLLERHYEEAAEGLVDKPPSRLLRGEGTEKNFFILKIDLVGSTQLLMGKRKGTYLKLAHTFLSSIDKITQDFGADPDQVEYAGDSVLAYFPEDAASAENVLTAACFSRAAVLGMQRLDATLRSLRLKCKVVIHFDTLLVSKIGPRASSILTAIGHPLHRVAKIEKEISADTGRATEKFFGQIAKENRKFLAPVYEEKQVPVFVPDIQALNGLFGLGKPSYNQPLVDIMFGNNQQAQQYRIEKTLIGYDLRWSMLFSALKLIG